MTFNSGLNQVSLSGLNNVPKEIEGSLAHQWLATWGIADRMAQELSIVGLPDLPKEIGFERLKMCGVYVLALNEQVEAGNHEAIALADKLGIALAMLAATLTLAPAEARSARAEWPAAHWESWRLVRRIVLGGGVLSGALGRQMYSSAQAWCMRLNPEVELVLAPKPRLLMLHGLARGFYQGTAVVMDAGHTAIKRGIAEVQQGEVIALHPDTMLPIPHMLSDPDLLLNFLLQTLIEQASRATEKPHQFGLSLSMEVNAEGNIPSNLPTTSFYRSLAKFQLTRELELRLSSHFGYPCTIKVMHEAKAAANGLAGVDAAILLGTSLGGTFRHE